jgi:hypothetical protein
MTIERNARNLFIEMRSISMPLYHQMIWFKFGHAVSSRYPIARWHTAQHAAAALPIQLSTSLPRTATRRSLQTNRASHPGSSKPSAATLTMHGRCPAATSTPRTTCLEHVCCSSARASRKTGRTPAEPRPTADLRRLPPRANPSRWRRPTSPADGSLPPGHSPSPG